MQMQILLILFSCSLPSADVHAAICC